MFDPSLGLSKNEVLKITSSNIHRSDSNVARSLGQRRPATSQKMRKGEKTEKISAQGHQLHLPATAPPSLRTVKEEMQTRGKATYLPVCITENQQTRSLGDSGIIQYHGICLLLGILSMHLNSYIHVFVSLGMFYIHEKSQS